MKFSIDLTYSDNIRTAAALGIVGQGITVNSAIGGWLDKSLASRNSKIPGRKVHRSETIEISLDLAQRSQFAELLQAQREHGGTIFCLLANSFVPCAGASILRLQCRVVDKVNARKVIKLIR